VNPIGVAIVALVIGLGIGVLLTWTALRTRQAEPSPIFDVAEPVVPAGVAEVLVVLPAAGVVVGPHDEVLQANATARSLGLVRGSRISVPELLQLVRIVRREGDVRSIDLQISRGDRAASSYLTARVAPLDESLILILADDQTTARRIEETRRDFVANISHELKTPIGAISLLAEAVEDAADDPAAVRRFASRMGIESARLTDLVGQIIELSRLQSDDPLADPEIVDVDEVLTDAVERRRMDAERRRITLTVAGVAGTRSATWLRTPLSIPTPERASSSRRMCKPEATTTTSKSQSPIMASAFRQPSSIGSSNASTASTMRAAEPTAALGSGWPS
jgi:two-component system, OmpR family, sensor histidine kinase SenX3